MDLPKELLQKHLPKKTQDSADAQTGKATRTLGAKSKKVVHSMAAGQTSMADMPFVSVADVAGDADEEGALFVQAMQVMVHQPRKQKKNPHHGTFPLPMPTLAVESPNTPPATSGGGAVSAPASPFGQGTTGEAIRRNTQDYSIPSPRAEHTGRQGCGANHVALQVAQMPACTNAGVYPVPPASSDNDDAFALAMRTVQPLKGKGREIPPLVMAVDAEAAQSLALHALLDSEIMFDVHLSGESVQGQVVGLDPKVLASLVSGSQSPEARLDLHGMNAAQAFQVLVPFFKSAWHKGLRTVIVVTGRGINSPTGMAVLRQKVSSWLTQEPFRRVVLAFSTAQPCDGGTGSMYVLLRKFRKKHPVYWERTPVDSDIF